MAVSRLPAANWACLLFAVRAQAAPTPCTAVLTLVVRVCVCVLSRSWSGVEYQAWTVLDTAEFVGQVLTICTSFALLLVGVLKAAVDGARRALLEEPVLQLQKVLAYVQQRLHSDLPPSIPDAVGHYEEVQVQFDVAAVELLRPLARAARALRL